MCPVGARLSGFPFASPRGRAGVAGGLRAAALLDVALGSTSAAKRPVSSSGVAKVGTISFVIMAFVQRLYRVRRYPARGRARLAGVFGHSRRYLESFNP